MTNTGAGIPYRPLGRTGLTVSIVGLGGHFKTRDGGRYWATFDGDEVPSDVVRNRSEVVSACADVGVNYIDITTAAECLAYGRALAGRRDHFILGADDYEQGLRNGCRCTVPGLARNVEQCLARLRTDYLDIWRVITDMHGRNTDSDVAVLLETADRLRQAGKIRHFGLSSHHPGWLKRVLATRDGIELVLFPCTATTRRAADGDSLFDVVRQRGAGLITIKPFAGGYLFTNRDRFPVRGPGRTDEHQLAQRTLRMIVARHPEITCVVAGLTTVQEVTTIAEAARCVPVALPPPVRKDLEEITAERLDQLPDDACWLRDWNLV